MGDFEEILARIITPGDEGVDPSIYDDLRASHTSRVGSGDAKVEELNHALRERDEEIARLKSHNYDLLMAIPKAEDEPQEVEEEQTEEVTDVESLFFEDKD